VKMRLLEQLFSGIAQQLSKQRYEISLETLWTKVKMITSGISVDGGSLHWKFPLGRVN
jgi:hypothetical protein